MFFIDYKNKYSQELKGYEVIKELTSETQEKISEIRANIMSHAYNYGSTDRAREEADKDVSFHLNRKGDKAYVYFVYINNNHKIELTEEDADNLFNNISRALIGEESTFLYE